VDDALHGAHPDTKLIGDLLDAFALLAGPVAKNRSLWRLGAHGSGACVAVARYRMGDFKWRHFRGEIILWAVRWYCKYGISYRELEEMMTERGVAVDHTTIYRWVQQYAPEMEKRLKWYLRSPLHQSWRVDETYVKVKGQCRTPDMNLTTN
jgi:hypothetical protein